MTAAGNGGVVCATDEVSARIEDLQFTLGEGVCVDAVQAGVPVLVGDLNDPGDIVTERWPTFMEGAARAGVRAVFAFPLRIGAITVGVLDLYRDRPGDLATVDILQQRSAHRSTMLAEHLQRALTAGSSSSRQRVSSLSATPWT